MLREFLSRIGGTFRRERLDKESDEEIRGHLEMLTERNVARGMERGEARRAARRQFGGLTQTKEDLRERRTLPQLDVLVKDVRYAFRQLRRAKWFTAAATLTLAFGIGASAALFAVLDAVVLRPLPYAEPDRLMAFRPIDQRSAPRLTLLSYPNFFDFRAQNQVFDHFVGYRDAQFTLTDSLPAIQVVGEIVSWDLFPLLGIQPQLGRGFLPDEEQPGTQVVVLGHALWRSRFGGDEGILGQAIPINGRLFTVVGVAPPGFQFPMDVPGVQLWVTFAADTDTLDQRGARMLEAVGRLKTGVSVEQAQSQMDPLAAALAQQYPDENKNRASTLIIPELERLTGSSRRAIWILLGAVGMLLLIGCANVANLLLARSPERASEFALRMALGAPRPAVVRQVLIESVTLGLLGTIGGVLLAVAALEAITPLAANHIPRIAQATVDGRVLAFSAIVALLTSTVFGLAPAFQAAGTDLAYGLKAGARNIAAGHGRLRNGLVVGQVTLGLVLVVGAELLMFSFLHLAQRDPGFRVERLLTFNVGLSESEYTVAEQIAFSDRLIKHLRAMPEVQGAAAGRPLPLQGHEMRIAFDVEGQEVGASDRPRSDAAIVTPGYFDAMGIPMLKGRDFSQGDNANAPPVLVVNHAFAKKYFPGQDVIGKRIRPGAGQPPTMREIVGVVGNAKQAALGSDPEPIYYFPYKQLPWGIGTIVLQTKVPPRQVESATRATLTRLAPHVPISRVRTGKDLSARAIGRIQFPMVLMGAFAAVALLLTMNGLYGVLSYSVARRRREIGLRIALGAGRREILVLVLREAAFLVAVGLALGTAAAIGTGHLLESLAYGIRPADPLIVAGACCLMVITSLVASYVPAARAATVDPTQALRSE